MRRVISITLFLFLFILIIDFRIRFIGAEASQTPFVLGFLLPMVSALLWGLVSGVFVLLGSSIIIGYFFLTPRDLTQLTTIDVKEMSLFVLEGIIILVLIFILKKSRENDHDLNERFRVILSSIQDIVIATDRKGVVTYINESAQKLFQIFDAERKKQALNRFIDIYGQKNKKYFQNILKGVIKDGRPFTLPDLIVIIINKSRHEMRATVAPLRGVGNRINGAVIILRDLSQELATEEQREVLLSSISHELKNYIASIEGYGHVIASKLAKKQESDIEGFMMKLNAKIKTMRIMITSMFDLSKLKLGRLDMKYDEFFLEELIGTVIHDMALTAEHKIVFDSKERVKVYADKLRLAQVLTNLLTNAMKYSPNKKKVIVTLQVKGREAIVGVQDFGMGITSFQMQKIFKPFYRAVTSVDEQVRGSGLGLFISREIIRQHAGRIWATSKINIGSTFYFALPFIAKPKPLSVQTQANLLEQVKKIIKFRQKTPIIKKL